MKTVKIDTVITIGMKEYAELKAKAEAMNAPDTVFLPRKQFDRIAKKADKYDALKAAARDVIETIASDWHINEFDPDEDYIETEIPANYVQKLAALLDGDE